MTKYGIQTFMCPANLKECQMIGICTYCKFYDNSIPVKDCITWKKFKTEDNREK